MRYSIRIGTVAGIGIFLHWTFLALLGWLIAGGVLSHQGLAPAGFILALFGCVLLHELGHALTAKRYGVETRDITMLPIGGLARLERIPEDPKQEFWIAIAGPLVNVAIAGVLAIVIAARGDAELLLHPFKRGANTLLYLYSVNLTLIAFNLLPAFPMDGGRILRAALAAKLGRRRATVIAANIGQIMAILFGIYGFFNSQVMLIFIAVFVYLGAQGEAEMVETTSLLEGLTVRDAMMTRFRTLAPEDNMERAVVELLAGSQQDFPVVGPTGIFGVLRREDIIRGLSEGKKDARVADVACRNCAAIQVEASLERTLEAMRSENCRTMPVLEGGQMIGLLTLENVTELVMVKAALGGPSRSKLLKKVQAAA
jgi:Zn-dependent protease